MMWWASFIHSNFKFNAASVYKKTTDLKRKGVINVNDTEKKAVFLIKIVKNTVYLVIN